MKALAPQNGSVHCIKNPFRNIPVFAILAELAAIVVFTMCSTSNLTSEQSNGNSLLLQVPQVPLPLTEFDTLFFSEHEPAAFVKIIDTIVDTAVDSTRLTIHTLPKWLHSEKNQYYLIREDTLTIGFTIDSAYTYLWDPGLYIDSIGIFRYDTLQYIPVVFEVFERGYFHCAYDTIFLLGPFDSCTIPVNNIGNASTALQPKTDLIVQNAITPNPIPARDSSNLQFTFSAESGMIGEYTAQFKFSADGSVTDSIIVKVINPRDRFYLLDHRIKEAAFSERTNRILSVPDDSSASCVYFIDPETRQSASIELSAHPTCVTMNFDGTLGAVGADGALFIIDMASGSIHSKYITDLPTTDIFMNSHSVYATCRNTDWNDNIICITLSSGRTYYSNAQLQGTCNGCMHPSGEYLYLITQGISPQDMHKIRLYADSAVYLYDSPYHGDYSFGNNIWATTERVIAYNTLFTVTDDQGTDMRYSGIINSYNLLTTIKNCYYSRERNVLYFINKNFLMGPAVEGEILQCNTGDFTCTAGYNLPRMGETDHFTYTEYELRQSHFFPSSSTANGYILADRLTIDKNSYSEFGSNSCIATISQSHFIPIADAPTGIIQRLWLP